MCKQTSHVTVKSGAGKSRPPIYTHTNTHSKPHPLRRFSCRASTVSSPMIPPTHKTMNVGANLTVSWCERVWDSGPGPVRNPVCLHVAKSACPSSCLLALVHCSGFYECVSSVWWRKVLIHVSLCFFTVCCSLWWRWVDMSFQHLSICFYDHISSFLIFFTIFCSLDW